MYSKEMKQALQAEIKLLEEAKGGHEKQIINIDQCILGLNNLLKENGEMPAKASKRAYKKRGRPGDIDTASKPEDGSSGHPKPHGRRPTDMSAAGIAKREYQRRWREAKKNAGLGSGGTIQKAKRSYTVKGTNIPKHDNAGAKFTLNREFDITDKEVRLMLSYLMSWKGLGRLEQNEIGTLIMFEGRNPVSLPESARTTIREIFYSARQRAMDKAKLSSMSQ